LFLVRVIYLSPLKHLMIVKETSKIFAGVCGLYCGNCPIFRARRDGHVEFLEFLANTIGVDEVSCDGCRSENCWSGDCYFKKCARERGVDFCSECPDYPCPQLLEFSEMASHRRVILENLEKIREVGWRRWIEEEDRKWRCPFCGSKVSFYNVKCPSCGAKLERV